MSVECCPAEWCLEGGGPPLTLFVKGNKKVGGGVRVFSLPVVETCPGRTPTCESACYGNRGDCRWLSVRQSHRLRLAAAEAPDFVDRAVAELHGGWAVRIHSVGDFYSAAYTAKWVAVAESGLNKYRRTTTKYYRVPRQIPHCSS